MKRNFADDIVVFGTGAVGYGLIEILWRGDTHPTMLLAGGVCLLSLGQMRRRMTNQPLLYKCIAGSGIITAIELSIGLVCNIGLHMNIWDYSRVPLNFHGQICLLFSVMWGFLSIGAMLLEKFLRKSLSVKSA